MLWCIEMTFAQVLETSVTTTDDSPSQNHPNPGNYTIQFTITPGFKPFANQLINQRSGISIKTFIERRLTSLRGITKGGPSPLIVAVKQKCPCSRVITNFIFPSQIGPHDDDDEVGMTNITQVKPFVENESCDLPPANQMKSQSALEDKLGSLKNLFFKPKPAAVSRRTAIKALKVDKISRFLFPAVFLLFNMGYWLSYKDALNR